MGIYESLGVRRVVNANRTVTGLGGSLMPEPVLQAMAEAARSFVDMAELQTAVSRRIATLTRNESALVCTGASAGLFLAALSCMTGADRTVIERLMAGGPAALARREVVIHGAHRNPYERAVRLAGARIVGVGNVWETSEPEFVAALTDRTAAVFYFAGTHFPRGALPLDTVIALSHAAGVPVVVDAAAQLPPPSNLWNFTAAGADLAVFSGGKALSGPQASGLIVGRKDLIDACVLHASPNTRLGRPMKVGKEEMVGLLTALEHYLSRDHDADLARIERATADWVELFAGIPGVTARRDFPNEAGAPLPRAIVAFDAALGTARGLQRALMNGEPAVAVEVAGDTSLYLNAELLEAGEAQIVSARLASLLNRAG